jgi:hypothetical protein
MSFKTLLIKVLFSIWLTSFYSISTWDKKCEIRNKHFRTKTSIYTKYEHIKCLKTTCQIISYIFFME